MEGPLGNEVKVRLPPVGYLKENIGPILSIITVVMGFGYLFLEIWFPLKQAAAVVGLIGGIIAFHFGSSPGSKNKDDIIAKQLERGKV